MLSELESPAALMAMSGNERCGLRFSDLHRCRDLRPATGHRSHILDVPIMYLYLVPVTLSVPLCQSLSIVSVYVCVYWYVSVLSVSMSLPAPISLSLCHCRSVALHLGFWVFSPILLCLNLRGCAYVCTHAMLPTVKCQALYHSESLCHSAATLSFPGLLAHL
jgi:hypothetical protein